MVHTLKDFTIFEDVLYIVWISYFFSIIPLELNKSECIKMECMQVGTQRQHCSKPCFMWWNYVVTPQYVVICYIERVLVSPTTCNTSEAQNLNRGALLTTSSVSFNTVHIKVIDPDANQCDMVSTLGVCAGDFPHLSIITCLYVYVVCLWKRNTVWNKPFLIECI